MALNENRLERPIGAARQLASQKPGVLPAPERRLRLVHAGGDAASFARFAARIYVADDGGPIRTIVGDGHRHFTGEEPSQKTGSSNPYEGSTEHALIFESELRADVSDYRTQAFRMRLRVGAGFREWICDHLRQVRVNGADMIEAIECKPNLAFLDADERAVQMAVRNVCTGLGWRHRIVYLRDVLGTGERQINFGEIMAHGTVPVPDESMAAFERLRIRSPEVSFRELREALHPERISGTAMAHALMRLGRVGFNLDRYLFDPMPVRLLPEPVFNNLIRF